MEAVFSMRTDKAYEGLMSDFRSTRLTMATQEHPVYRADIDGMRAVAVLSVIVYHLIPSWLPGGYTGVDVFFVISGFVVAASLGAIRDRSLHGFLGEFYARRLARILPALVWMLVATAIAATLFIPSAWLSDLSDRTGLFAFFGLSNYVMQTNVDTYFAPRAEFNPFMHTWSLGVEEQYYLVVPLIFFAWGLPVFARVQRIQLAVMGGLVIVSLAACYWYARHQPTTAFYFVVCRFWELGVGALLFLSGRKFAVPDGLLKGRGSRVAANTVAGFGVLLVLYAYVSTEPAKFPWPGAIVPVVGTVLLLVSAEASYLCSVLSSKPMVWIGKRSYSLYLWHWPVFVLMRWTMGLQEEWHYLVAIFLTILLAVLSYSVIEKPLRYAKFLTRLPRFSVILFFLAMPVAGFLYSDHLFKNRTEYSLSVVEKNSADWHAGLRNPYGDPGSKRCKIDFAFLGFHGGGRINYHTSGCEGELVGRHLFVAGDSHAGMQGRMFERLAAEKGINVSVFTFPGCAVFDLKTPIASHQSGGCAEFIDTVTDYITSNARAGDIVFFPSLRLDRMSDQGQSFNVSDIYIQMYSGARGQLRRAAVAEAKERLRRFTESSINVVFSAPTPLLAFPPFRCSDWFNQRNPVCTRSPAELTFAKLRQSVMDDLEAISAAVGRVSIWDPSPVLCPEEPCRTQVDGKPLFFDGDHFSGYANDFLYPHFERFIEGLGANNDVYPGLTRSRRVDGV